MTSASLIEMAIAAARGCVKRNQTILASDAEILLAEYDRMQVALKKARILAKVVRAILPNTDFITRGDLKEAMRSFRAADRL